MKTKIPTSTFIALTDDIADWLMLESLGEKTYKSFVVESNGGQSFNDEGLDMYIEWNNQVEEMLSTYFKNGGLRLWVEKNKWELERDKADALRTKAMKSLTVDQLNAIKDTHKTLADCLMMIRDCNDLYLSDTRKLDDAFWKLQNEFNLGER